MYKKIHVRSTETNSNHEIYLQAPDIGHVHTECCWNKHVSSVISTVIILGIFMLYLLLEITQRKKIT